MGRELKKKGSVANSNFIALILVTLLNIGIIVFLVILGQFVTVKSDWFIIGILVMLAVTLLFNLLYLLAYVKGVRVLRKGFMSVLAIIVVIGSVGTFYLVWGNDSLNTMIDKSNVEEVEYSIITMKDTHTLDNIDNKTVAYINVNEDTNNTFNNEIQKYSRTANTAMYEDNTIYSDLVSGKVDYAIVPVTFKSQFKPDDDEETVNEIISATVLTSFKTKIDVVSTNKDVISEPFSVLVLGNNEGLSDSIMIVTVNPQTLTFTMSSISRDSYVERGCRSGYDKLNHNRGEGRECITNAIENMLGIEIDYYFETDFYALVKIVDALGGVELYSPHTFAGSLPMEGHEDACTFYDPEYCEGVTVNEGTHVRNGKEAITFARERKTMPGEDFTRQMNQQYVIQQVAAKILSTRSIDTLVRVLDAAKNNISTNLTTEDISGLMGYYLQYAQSSKTDLLSTFRIYQSQITGEGAFIDEVWYSIVDQEQLAETRALIRWNLTDGWDLENEYEMSFSVNSPYTPPLPQPTNEDYAGNSYLGSVSGNSNNSSNEPEEVIEQKPDVNIVDNSITVPNLLGMGESEIYAWGSANGVEIAIVDREYLMSENTSGFEHGQLISQSTQPGYYEDGIGYIEIGRVVLVDDSPLDPDVNNSGDNTESGNTE